MFSNLVNIHDIPLLIEKIRQGNIRDLLLRLLGGIGMCRIKSWDHLHYSPNNWWDIPEVMERWNLMTSGVSGEDYFSYFFNRYVTGRDGMRALSLGCGTGHRELHLAGLSEFRRIDAIDMSEVRIEHAREKAESEGHGGKINYIAGNVHSIEIPDNCYDLVLAEQSLHHFSPLDEILKKVESSLKPDGNFIFNEFTGPSRFQWTKEQLEAVNGILEILPEKYRIRWKSGTIKRKVHRPGRLSMILYDRTEAVESSRILPLIGGIFDVIEIKGYGGTVLQPLFNDIAHNFLSKDSETQDLLRMCFDIEDELLGSGRLGSDFVVGICGKRIEAVRRKDEAREVDRDSIRG